MRKKNEIWLRGSAALPAFGRAVLLHRRIISDIAQRKFIPVVRQSWQIHSAQ
jgi:hypothetical protein